MSQYVFAGRLTYANAHAMEYAIDRFMRSKSLLTPLALLTFDGLSVDVEFRALGYCDPSYAADFAVLAAPAVAGGMTVVDDRGREVEQIAHGGGKLPPRMPARHRRWELFANAKSAEALRAIVAEGGDPKQRLGPLGVTALHVAARAGADEAVAFLLERKVPVDARTIEDTTPIAFAATAAVARRLIAAGADLARDVNGVALVVNTARLGRGEVVRELLRAGVRVPEDGHAEVAAALAAGGELELLRELATGDAAFREACAQDSVVDAAIRVDSEVSLDLLLSLGARLPADFIARAAAFGARTHLIAALRAPDAVAGAGPSSNDRDAMCLAAAYGRIESMQLLADAGVPVEPARRGATSPLIWSVWSAALEPDACIATATWLLARGASIDAVNARKRPALAFAVERESRHAAAFLVERGASTALLSREAQGALAELLR